MRLLQLPIDVKYALVDIQDCGEIATTCANCALPIRNIATIKSINGTYSTGVDCAESLVLNANKNFTNMQQIKLVKREIQRVSKAKRLIARGGTPTLFGNGYTNLVVCYQDDNSNKWFEVVQMFKTPLTSLPQQLANKYHNAPKLTCLNDARQYATALTAN